LGFVDLFATATTKTLQNEPSEHVRLAQPYGPQIFLLSMSAHSNWPRNRLLLALPLADLTRLLPALEHISCEREQVLLDVDSPLDHVFFPDSGVISAVAVYADGRTICHCQG
jgi:hypothetical protein